MSRGAYNRLADNDARYERYKKLVVRGLSRAEIAECFGISPRAVDHLRHRLTQEQRAAQ